MKYIMESLYYRPLIKDYHNTMIIIDSTMGYPIKITKNYIIYDHYSLGMNNILFRFLKICKRYEENKYNRL